MPETDLSVEVENGEDQGNVVNKKKAFLLTSLHVLVQRRTTRSEHKNVSFSFAMKAHFRCFWKLI